MKLYVVRHGKTDWNVMGKMQGSTDTSLNEIGIKQAELAKKKIKEQIDICISSPLSRTKETASIICNLPIITDERLIERKMGEFEGKPSVLYHGHDFWNYKLNKSDYGVEPIKYLFKRVNEFLNEIKCKYSDKTVLVVSHGATVRAINFCINGYTEDTDFLSFDVPNCAIFEYDVK